MVVVDNLFSILKIGIRSEKFRVSGSQRYIVLAFDVFGTAGTIRVRIQQLLNITFLLLAYTLFKKIQLFVKRRRNGYELTGWFIHTEWS